MTARVRIGLFGGSFNPPHAAHQLVALYVLETQPVDEVWFVPAFRHPFGKDLAPFADRVAMCELACAPLGSRARTSRAEEELAARPGFTVSHTIDLIASLEAPDRALRLVIGADILGDTPKWHRWDEVARRAPPIVVGRTGAAATPPGASVTEVAMPDISATRVRALLHGLPAEARRAGERGLAGLLPREVLRYIAERELY